CHDHKFDPILQKDYYRMQACFGTMIPRDDIPAADLADRQKYDRARAAWLQRAADLRQQLAAIRDPYLERAAKGAVERFPEDVQAVMAKAPGERTPLDQQLADLVNRQVAFDQQRMKVKDEDQKRIDELEKQIAELSGQEPPALPSAITVQDVGPQPQPVHMGGNPSREVTPAGGFSILSPAPFDLRPSEHSSGQRTALAKWIASPENPLTARVIVNRIWQRHFGTGLVGTSSDFGSLGDRPSHPELLDWLTGEFIANGWSIKWLHRQILNSETWRMSSFHPQAAEYSRTDPTEELRWRFSIRRLNAEQIRDAMLATSGELLSEQGGPSVDYDSLRRSLYLKAKRNTPDELIRSLDGVDGLNSTAKRNTTTTPVQALNLMNGDWVRKRTTSMTQRVMEQSPSEEPTDLAVTAFRLALGRTPEADELSVAESLMQAARSGMTSSPETESRFAALPDDKGGAVAVRDSGKDGPLATKSVSPAVTAPFSFVGLIRLESLYSDATVRTIVSQWDSDSGHRGWAIGVTSEKSRYQPRNLILQVVSDRGYEVVASNLRPELNRTYMAAVAVSETADGHGEASFTLQPFGAEAAAAQTATVEFRSAKELTGKFPLVVGGRAKQSRHRWDGQLDQLAVFSTALTPQQVQNLFDAQLRDVADAAPVAFWNFESGQQPTADASGESHHLTTVSSADSPIGPTERSVAELCHVLLNSNEFVYID
ncbi:MAG: DUF1553 domain-containing protein, partial [Planctomycetaceae bacterium]|nr:DUF1553 domain-containing protein [Planctomycetaceae bacterium]